MKNETEKTVMRGGTGTLMVVVLNSLGVLLMLHSGSRISAISSVPYAFRKVMPWLTLGTWTYIFQGTARLYADAYAEKFVPTYLFSLWSALCLENAVGSSRLWITRLPVNLPLRVLYFVLEAI